MKIIKFARFVVNTAYLVASGCGLLGKGSRSQQLLPVRLNFSECRRWQRFMRTNILLRAIMRSSVTSTPINPSHPSNSMECQCKHSKEGQDCQCHQFIKQHHTGRSHHIMGLVRDTWGNWRTNFMSRNGGL